MPRCITKFLSDVTIGKLRVPNEFFVPFEEKMVSNSFNKEGKLIPIQAIKELDEKPLLRANEIEKRKRQVTLICSTFIISKVFTQGILCNSEVIKLEFPGLSEGER